MRELRLRSISQCDHGLESFSSFLVIALMLTIALIANMAISNDFLYTYKKKSRGTYPTRYD